jgi:predicted nucleic acid-binding protein
MLSIVLDTNVLVSALIIQGSIPDYIIAMVKSGILHPLYSNEILRQPLFKDIIQKNRRKTARIAIPR